MRNSTKDMAQAISYEEFQRWNHYSRMIVRVAREVFDKRPGDLTLAESQQILPRVLEYIADHMETQKLKGVHEP